MGNLWVEAKSGKEAGDEEAKEEADLDEDPFDRCNCKAPQVAAGEGADGGERWGSNGPIFENRQGSPLVGIPLA